MCTDHMQILCSFIHCIQASKEFGIMENIVQGYGMQIHISKKIIEKNGQKEFISSEVTDRY